MCVRLVYYSHALHEWSNARGRTFQKYINHCQSRYTYIPIYIKPIGKINQAKKKQTTGDLKTREKKTQPMMKRSRTIGTSTSTRNKKILFVVVIITLHQLISKCYSISKTTKYNRINKNNNNIINRIINIVNQESKPQSLTTKTTISNIICKNSCQHIPSNINLQQQQQQQQQQQYTSKKITKSSSRLQSDFVLRLSYGGDQNQEEQHQEPYQQNEQEIIPMYVNNRLVQREPSQELPITPVLSTSSSSSSTSTTTISNIFTKILSIMSLIVSHLPSKSTILATVLAIMLMREWWDKMPRWIRRSIGSVISGFQFFTSTTKIDNDTTTNGTTRSGGTGDGSILSKGIDWTGSLTLSNDNDNDDDNLTSVDSIFVLVQKFQRVLKLAETKFNTMPTNNLTKLEGFQEQLALITTLLLIQETKERTGGILWDNYHTQSGTPIVFTLQQLHYLKQMLHISHWAYLEDYDTIKLKLSTIGYTLVRNIHPDEPGRVGHYIAIDEKKKIVLIAVKGSSSLSDFATDSAGTPYSYTFDTNPFSDNTVPTTISCHEGILEASINLCDDIQSLVEHLFIPSGFKILLTGHSLGAGTAVVVGTLLRSRIPRLKKGGINSLEVIVYASPPIYNYVAAKACTNFVTCIVNNLDIVPRMSINNAVSLLQFCGIVYNNLTIKGYAPTNPRVAFDLINKFVLQRNNSKKKKKMDAKDIDKKIENVDNASTTTASTIDTTTESDENDKTNIMSPDELFRSLTEASDKGIELMDMNHLYVPGKVYYIYTKVGGTSTTATTDDTTTTTTTTTDTTNTTSTSEESNNKKQQQSYSAAIVTDGSCRVLQHISVGIQMAKDHMCTSYMETLEGTWELSPKDVSSSSSSKR